MIIIAMVNDLLACMCIQFHLTLKEVYKLTFYSPSPSPSLLPMTCITNLLAYEMAFPQLVRFLECLLACLCLHVQFHLTLKEVYKLTCDVSCIYVVTHPQPTPQPSPLPVILCITNLLAYEMAFPQLLHFLNKENYE